ncbi:MAG: protein translocase subunit SecD [Candidatus Cloacimonetes bacterium HGW-Cloacimonetes-1]|jgi:protein-export membrane protein SecD|nr:MAG: protein translocase subunit SecD [Candidatus Cloacimonetes bacterium HGW-Cloacimonetes-1]
MKKFSWRGISIIIFLCVIAYFLAPLAVPNLPEWWAKHTLKLGLDLRGGMQILLEVDTTNLSETDARNAVEQNIRIIRERIDQFGVAEPIIQKLGERRILVQLPGVDNFSGAEALIKQTAMLDFKVVADRSAAEQVIKLIDAMVSANISQFPKLAALDAKDKSSKTVNDTTAVADSIRAGSGIFSSLTRPGESEYSIQYSDVPLVRELLADSLFQQFVPNGYQLALDKADEATQRADRSLFVLQSNSELSGGDLSKAIMEYGSPSSTDPNVANKPYVSLEFTRDGARKFESVTANNVDKRLAIVLDGVVYSAPNIRERISGGRAQITGRFSSQEAHELSIVLNTGNLKAPISPISTVIVGATLGSDSIKSGKMAGIIGFLAVFLFMLVYYKMSGLIANIGLIFNIGFVLAMLTAFGASLTLPGIAGIILTIGMAVDANVLIYERIREELESGKSPHSALDAGYNRAAITIWDSQITTLIAAAVLYNFGTGPIRGFALTLAIGIFGSMFCALVFVRSIIDSFVIVGTKKTLSI